MTKLLHFRQKSSTFVALFAAMQLSLCPKVENFCGGVRVTIERTVFVKLSHVGSSVTSMLPVKLTERQQDMLELIRKNPFISAQQMLVVLSVVKRTIERDLADLQKKGILIREGNTSAGHWEIIEK